MKRLATLALLLILNTSLYAGECNCSKVAVCPCKDKTPCVCTAKKTPEQVIRENKLSRDERKDTWVQDVNQPGRWWYGYYVTDKNGTRFIARFTYLSPMNDFRGVYPMNYQLSQRKNKSIPVIYKGK